MLHLIFLFSTIKLKKKNFIKNQIIKQLELSQILCAVCPNNVI